MRADEPVRPRPRLTGYALWLIASRLGAPVLVTAAVLDVLLG